MTLEIPTWLNLCFMEKIMRKSEGDNSIQVIDIVTRPATSKGDSYTSDMFRITAEFSRDQSGLMITEKKSVIIKIAPTFGIRHELAVQSGIFQIEISMMTDTLDKMNKLLGSMHRLSGKALYAQIENPMLLVIEDLAPLGFCLADPTSGLDLAHSILVINGLARFHAASVALCEKEPNQKKMYTKGLFDRDHPPIMKNFFIMSTKAFADEITNWPEAKKYSEKVAKLADHICQIGDDASKLFDDEFNVINHSDMHTKNMLFKYNDGKPIDHILVDFQTCFYNSPTLDLLYFFNSSLSPDVYENKRDILLNEYLDTLSATMKQLNCKTRPPTIEELTATLKRRVSYGMIASFAILPFMLCSEIEVVDFDDFMGTGTYINPGLKSEGYKKLMLKRLPLYDELGLLDL